MHEDERKAQQNRRFFEMATDVPEANTAATRSGPRFNVTLIPAR
jgi:hypothetical protein